MTFNAATFVSSIEFVDKKIPLPQFCQRLRQLGLPLSNSWGKTLGELKDLADSKTTPQNILDSLEQLGEWVSEYLMAHSKALLVFPVSHTTHGTSASLARNFEKGLPLIHLLSDHPRPFPSLLSKLEVGAFNGRIVLRHIIRESDYTSFIFSAVKSYQVRDVIPISVSDGIALTKLSGYSKVIAIKTASHEHIDIIRFRTAAGVSKFEGDGIDLFLDITKPGLTPLNYDEISARAKQYTAALTGSISAAAGAFNLPTAVNFFPAMQKIYQSTSGNICELGFTTTLGGSVKREKMKKNTADLRTETWHAGGHLAISSAAIPDTIDIYRLGVSWKIAGNDDEPILIIPGRYRSLSTLDVDHALILGCTGPEAVHFTFTQLMAYC